LEILLLLHSKNKNNKGTIRFLPVGPGKK